MVNKKVTLKLVGLNGNAFSLMGAFHKQARREGWSKDEIKEVLSECTKGDYNHLLVTLITYCEPPDEDYDDEDYDDEDWELC